MLDAFEWSPWEVEEVERECETSERVDRAVMNEIVDVPSTTGPDRYGSAKSKAGSVQARINATGTQHGRMGNWPNTNTDFTLSYLEAYEHR